MDNPERVAAPVTSAEPPPPLPSPAAAAPAPSTPGSGPSTRGRALAVFAAMGQRFSDNYEISQSKAYRQLLKDLMENISLLVDGGVMEAKDILSKIEDLQKHLKAGGDEGKRSLPEMFSDWLNGDEVTQ